MGYVNLMQTVNMINSSIMSVKEEIQLKQEHLLLQQNEMHKAQHQLVRRQDQLFSKQDQIQSTLADNQMSTPSKSSTVAWPSTSYPTVPNVGTTASSSTYFNQGAPPLQLDASEISSYVSDIDLDSLLALDWDAPSSSNRQVEINQIVNPISFSQSKNMDGPSTNYHIGDQSNVFKTPKEQSEKKVKLIDPSIVIKNNPHLYNEDNVGRLAVTLAREAFFGETVSTESTVTGKKDKSSNKPALDHSKLSSLLSAIHANPAFSQMSKETFSTLIKPKIMTAIRHHCKYLRQKKGNCQDLITK